MVWFTLGSAEILLAGLQPSAAVIPVAAPRINGPALPAAPHPSLQVQGRSLQAAAPQGLVVKGGLSVTGQLSSATLQTGSAVVTGDLNATGGTATVTGLKAAYLDVSGNAKVGWGLRWPVGSLAADECAWAEFGWHVGVV